MILTDNGKGDTDFCKGTEHYKEGSLQGQLQVKMKCARWSDCLHFLEREVD